MKRIVLPLVAVVMLAALGAATADGASHVRIPGCGGTDRAQYKPDKVIVACGDGNFFVVNIEWAKWTRKAASGAGTGKLNDCMPNCAQGQFRSHRVKLIASKPVTCSNGKREFSRIAWYFRHKPRGTARKGSVHRPCSR
jgi:hypothetical protein